MSSTNKTIVGIKSREYLLLSLRNGTPPPLSPTPSSAALQSASHLSSEITNNACWIQINVSNAGLDAIGHDDNAHLQQIRHRSENVFLFSEVCGEWDGGSAADENVLEIHISKGQPTSQVISIHFVFLRIMGRSLFTVGALVFALLLGLIRLLRVGRRPKGYPPGPPTVPILGNLHLVRLNYARLHS